MPTGRTMMVQKRARLPISRGFHSHTLVINPAAKQLGRNFEVVLRRVEPGCALPGRPGAGFVPSGDPERGRAVGSDRHGPVTDGLIRPEMAEISLPFPMVNIAF